MTFVNMYKPDGHKVSVPANKVLSYKKKGWTTEPPKKKEAPKPVAPKASKPSSSKG